MTHIADKTEADAWKDVKQASDEHDIADFKEAVQVLVKVCPELTYPKLEEEFRKRQLNVYFIAVVSEVGSMLLYQLPNSLFLYRRKFMLTHLLPLTYNANLIKNIQLCSF